MKVSIILYKPIPNPSLKVLMFCFFRLVLFCFYLPFVIFFSVQYDERGKYDDLEQICESSETSSE